MLQAQQMCEKLPTSISIFELSQNASPTGSHSRNSESSVALDTLCIYFYDSFGLGLKCNGKCQQHFGKCSFIVTALTSIVQTASQNGFRQFASEVSHIDRQNEE